ncbi:RNA polymerase sigma factor [Patulibacter sp. NPDC049589]|uniref:RNA polymerase sigma factor n=1 Tax=Patulibacter sp. NPDC049589 TaxID=3154731 RepID=UPI00343CE200
MARDLDIDALYARHRRELLRWFARRTADAESALDLLAETFAQAIAARRGCRARTDEARAAWLWGIAHRQLARYLRRGYAEQRAIRRLGLERPPVDEPVLAAIEREAGLDDLRSRLADALETLGPNVRQAVELRVVDELPYPDVARHLRISEPAARARVSRGLNALGRVLDPAVAGEVAPS